MNTGLVSLTDLGTWCTRAFRELGWYAGVMLWQYRSDTGGAGIAAAAQGLLTSYIAAGLPVNPPQMSAPQASGEGVEISVPNTRINYPIRFTWVNSLEHWWPV